MGGAGVGLFVALVSLVALFVEQNCGGLPVQFTLFQELCTETGHLAYWGHDIGYLMGFVQLISDFLLLILLLLFVLLF